MIASMDAALRRQFLALLDADLRLASAGVPEEELHGKEGWGAVRMIWAHERQRRTLETGRTLSRAERRKEQVDLAVAAVASYPQGHQRASTRR